MKKILSFTLSTIFCIPFAFGWGQTGHRVVGYIAQKHLNKEVLRKVENILDGESLAIAATWMDDMRSNPKYDYTHDWHWVSIPDTVPYAKSKKNPKGDVVEEIPKLIKALKTHKLDPKTEEIDLKFLIHLVGDIHQPLHVGRADDRGGNSIKIKFFWKYSNLHRIWDSGMIDDKKLSYTELGNAIDHATPAQIKKWQSATILDWVKEDKALRKQIYDFGDKTNLSYDYVYKNWGTVCNQLEKAGIRLAGILNSIYGK